MKLLIEASEIPHDAIVTKLHGEYLYRLKKYVRIYQQGVEEPLVPLKIEANNVVFLTDKTGEINAYPGTTQFLWGVTEAELLAWLKNRRDKESHQ